MTETEFMPTIGLEIHAELKTRTKMFCDSKNDPDETRPNVNICPVCMGHPGTLPVINKEAVRHVLRVGVALGGTFADRASFARKNYFYPDIPKGYQISQYEHPLVSGGSLNNVAMTRVHLEEDTGTSVHDKGGYSLLDFNRAGVPLMELVTEPVIHSAKESAHFARELQLLLRYLGASDANMEKGEMRVEANISIGEWKSKTLGTKVEIKNLNSFKAVERAIEYEVKRQSELLEKGEEVMQETRGWDEQKGRTFSQRRKEKSHDYRYFPEPDIPVLSLKDAPEFTETTLRATLPELPSARRMRYLREGISPATAEMFIVDARYGALFEETVACIRTSEKDAADTPALIANYISTDIAGLVTTHGETGLAHIIPQELAACLTRLLHGGISSRGAKDAIAEVFEKGGNLAEISKKYVQQSNTHELSKIIDEVLRTNAHAVADYRKGKVSVLQFLVGQCMKATRGAGNPQVLRNLLLASLR